jgi:hypothetical protein
MRLRRKRREFIYPKIDVADLESELEVQRAVRPGVGRARADQRLRFGPRLFAGDQVSLQICVFL